MGYSCHNSITSTSSVRARIASNSAGKSSSPSSARNCPVKMQNAMAPAWFYLDREGAEFGPFQSDKMRAWYLYGYFPVALRVRLEDWKQHIDVRDLLPFEDPFSGEPPCCVGVWEPLEMQTRDGGDTLLWSNLDSIGCWPFAGGL